MIILSEQYGYRKPRAIKDIDRFSTRLKNKNYSKSIQSGEKKAYCYNIIYSGEETNNFLFEISYFVGVDWIVENELSIYVKPKDEDTTEVNYLKMLFDALKEPENYIHLDQLCKIYFDKPAIVIKQKDDLLTPLLLIQYINILKRIVQKGLKKSYFQVTKNLNAKMKGKVLINETIKKNHFNNKMLYNYCQYTEFGINSTENKILKKALSFSIAAMQNINGIEVAHLNGLINYIQPAFANVDNEVDIYELKNIKSNKLFREYDQALKFANLILKRYGYNISSAKSTEIKTPPFWIDMSKLFELYVFAKLKEKFPLHHEVTYHKKFKGLEPDFIVNSNDGVYKMIVDAKYKPQYQDSNISKEDIRQISGYARMKSIYDFIGIEYDKIIDCLVIYSNKNAKRLDFKNVNFTSEDNEEKNYVRFFKIGIELPVK